MAIELTPVIIVIIHFTANVNLTGTNPPQRQEGIWYNDIQQGCFMSRTELVATKRERMFIIRDS